MPLTRLRPASPPPFAVTPAPPSPRPASVARFALAVLAASLFAAAGSRAPAQAPAGAVPAGAVPAGEIAASEIDLSLVPQDARAAAARRNVELKTLEDGPNGVVLHLANRNLPDKQDYPLRVQRFVALPPTGMPVVRLIDAKYRLLDYRDNVYHFDPASVDASDPLAPRPSASLKAEIGEFVSVRELGAFRGWRLGFLEITLANRAEVLPSRYDYLRLDEATFALDYPEPLPATSPDTVENFLERDFFRRIVVNPYVPPLLDPIDGIENFAAEGVWIELLQRAAARGPVVKMLAYEPGIHRFDGADLEAAGVALSGAASANFRLYHMGREVPFFAERASGNMSASDQFYFYAPGELGERYTEAFWLFANAGPLAPTPPLRVPAPAAASASASSAPPVEAVARWRWAERTGYERKLRPELGFSRWFWERVPMGQFHEFPFELETLPVASADAPPTISLDAAITTARGRFVMKVYLNGLLIGNEELNQSRNVRLSFTAPPAYFFKGSNILAVEVEGTGSGEGTGEALVKGFTLSGAVDLPSADRPFFNLRLAPVGPEGGSLAANAAWAESAIAWDATNPLSPKPLSVAPAAGGANARFLLTPGATSVAIVDRDSARRPGEIRLRPAPTVADRSRGGNYVVVHHADFAQGARDLAALHARDRSIIPRLLDVEEMYDAFDYGRPGSAALARGLRYAYRSWPEPRPFHVVLVGEASEWRGDPATLPPGVGPDFVPVYDIESVEENILRGDHRYGLLRDGDLFPSLVMSRLPVSTPEQLAGMIEKERRYAEEPFAGPWQIENLFVADDEPEFASAARDIVASSFHRRSLAQLIDQSSFPYRTLPRVSGAKHAEAGTEYLVKAFNKGALSVNFFGHGGPNIWTHERLFHLTDLDLLTNKRSPAFVTCSSCDNAWLDYPLPPVNQSMGERLATMPEGGAIAVFAPTAGGYTSDHRLLIDALWDGVFNLGLRSVGEASFQARLAYIAKTGRTNITDQFVLIGDPATRLAIPPEAGELVFEPRFVNSAIGGVVTFSGNLGQPVWGWAEIALASDLTGETLGTTRARVRSGFFGGQIPLGPHALDGRVNGLASVYNPTRGLSTLLRGSFVAAEPKLRWEEPLRVHEIEMRGELGTLTFPLTVHNPLPLPVERALVRISRAGIPRPIFERRFRFEPGESKPIEFRWVAAPGAYAVTVDLETGDHPSQKRSNELTVVAFNPDLPADFVVSESTLQFTPETMSPGRHVTGRIALFNAGGAKLPDGTKPARLAARLVHGKTGEALSHRFLFEPPAGGRFVDLRLVTKEPLAEYKAPVALSIATDETDQEIKRIELPIAWARGADLSIVAGTLRFASEEYREGQTVFVEAEVENVGDAPSDPFEMAAYLDEPWTAANLLHSLAQRAAKIEPPLGPGERRKVSVRWDSFDKRGEQVVFLVANNQKQAFEQTLANNVLRGVVTLKPHPDYRVESMEIAPAVVRRDGKEILLKAVVVNDADQPIAGLPVAARLRSSLDASVEAVSDSTTVDIPAGGKAEVSFRLAASRRHAVAEVEANPERRLFERDVENNVASLELASPLTAADFLKVPSGGLSYRGTPRRGRADGWAPKPDDAIGPTTDLLHGARYVPFDPTLLVRYARPNTGSTPQESDNAWTVERSLLEAGPRENAERLRLAIPAETGRKGAHVVRARLQRRADRDGFPSTRFQLRAEEEAEFRRFDFAPGPNDPKHTVATVDLGVFDLRDGVFDAELDDVDDGWSVLYGFEFTPADGWYEAPAADVASLREHFGAGDSVRFRLRATRPEGSVLRFQRRFGRVEANDKAVAWGEWSDDAGALSEGGGEAFALSGADSGDLLQWRALFVRAPGDYPIINDALIERAE
jgi:hypothetical protein